LNSFNFTILKLDQTTMITTEALARLMRYKRMLRFS